MRRQTPRKGTTEKMKLKIPNLSQLFDNRPFRIIISILIAIISWTVIVNTVETDYEDTISAIPVDFTAGQSATRTLGLSIIGSPQATVNVEVRGERGFISSLRTVDVNVQVRYDIVTGPGTYDLPVVVSKADNYADFDILSVNPSTVEVTFDRIESKTLPIEVNTRDLIVASGYVAGVPTASPAELMIQGPESEVARVARAVVTYSGTEELSERSIGVGDIELFDVDGNLLSAEIFTMSADEAEVNIPILKLGEMQTKIEFTNIPEGFDIESFKYTIDPAVIPVAGAEEDIDKAGDLLLGYIDLQQFELKALYEFNVTLPTGFTNLENIQTANVTFDTENLSERTITVSDFRIRNENQNINVEFITEQIQDVHLIGSLESLEQLQQASVIAEIDMEDITTAQGSQTVPVSIVITANDDVIAVGSYSAVVEVQ